MPTIKSSADLRNSYNEISTFCHQYGEPVFITKSKHTNAFSDVSSSMASFRKA
jgi:hypothetical protein